MCSESERHLTKVQIENKKRKNSRTKAKHFEKFHFADICRLRNTKKKRKNQAPNG